MRKWNKEFDVEEIGNNCFYIILVDDICEDNISDCINSDGQLLYDDENHTKRVQINLKYTEIDIDNSNLSLNADATLEFESNEIFYMKGAFVVNDAGYVLGYSILTRSVSVTNQMIFKKDLVFWDIVEGETHV